jgi:dipeptidyl aminopeptidase/acylaminoacyl peptidase
MKRLLRWIVLIALFAGLLFVGVSWVYAHRLTRARPNTVGSPPADFPFAIENVTFTSSDQQTLAGWLVPAPNSERAIVLLHGYTGTRRQMLPRARFFREQGYTVFLYDARAGGESTGDQVSFGYRERHDVIAAVKFLRDRGCKDIACLGVSQGGATILFAAKELPDVTCVICESVFDEMTHAVDRRMRRYTGVPGCLGACLMVPFAEHRLGLVIDDVRPVDHIAALKCPVFIISGEKDDRTWPEDTQRLFEAAREPKQLWMLPDAGHEDLFRFAGYEAKVLDFLRTSERLLIARSP